MTQTTIKQTGAEKIHWDLSDLFSSIEDPKIAAILDKAKKEAVDFEARYKGKLAGLSPSECASAHNELETLMMPLYKVSQYVHLVYATKTDDDAVKALVAEVDEVGSRLGNHVVFFDLECGALSEEIYTTFRDSNEMAPYQYSLIRSKETAQYNLSEKEEQLINLKDLTGCDAWQKFYNELTSEFRFEFTVDGETKTMNGSELRALRYHPEQKVRCEAMSCFFSRYEEQKLAVTHAFNHIVKDCAIEREIRGYKSPISVRNVQNDLDDKVVQVLHEVTQESSHLVNRYYKLKARLLSLERFTLADIYAPLPQSSTSFTWDQATDLVLRGFQNFDPTFHEMAKKMFDENRVDAPVTASKRGGAFCSSSTPDVAPYVLLNFLGKQRDVSTMAHELGHAIHDMYCSKQNLFNYHPILPLAETASVFSEMIVTDLLLKEQTDKTSKVALLTEKLEDIFATSHRQNMFSFFEQTIHAQIEKGLMSTTELCETYQSSLESMFGDAVTYTPEYQWEWSTIPHLVESPFYVYAYNFGNLLVMALYQSYLEEGASFIPKFKELLSLGSSKSPVAITQVVGVDITDPNFWRKSLVYTEHLIDELESLI